MKPCTWCLLDLTSSFSVLSVQWPPEENTPERWQGSQGRLGRRIEVLTEALASGWPASINDTPVGPPVSTWHGDPVCETHLHQIARELEQPQTVRMAQWGPRR